MGGGGAGGLVVDGEAGGVEGGGEGFGCEVGEVAGEGALPGGGADAGPLADDDVEPAVVQDAAEFGERAGDGGGREVAEGGEAPDSVEGVGGEGEAAQVALAEMPGVVEAPGLMEHGPGQVEAHDFGPGQAEQGGVAARAAAGIEDAWTDVRGWRGQAGEALGFVRGGVVVDAAGVVHGHALVGSAVGLYPGVGVAWRRPG